MARAALDDAAEDLTVGLEVFEVWGRVERRFEPIGNRVSADFG